jgi:acetyl-CoA synthetase
VAAEAVDRHARERPDKVAIHSVRASGEVQSLTFGDVSRLSSKFADGLRQLGVGKGDRVFVYLDRRSELFISIIGIVKMGGIACPLFSALGPEAVKDRLSDGAPAAIVTSPYLYERIASVLKDASPSPRVICVGEGCPAKAVSYSQVLASGSPEFAAIDMRPDEPYIIHYTSGSTGKPKGVVLPHRAMLQQLSGAKYVSDLRENDVFWCTADPGWVTGTSMGIFGPWYLGITIISFEGRFDARSWYSIVDRFKVTVWFTAPTALRMLMKAGDEVVREFDLSSLRHMCSAGEPLNPHVVRWGMEVLERRIHDNWWQTETGAPCISNFPCMTVKPGSMARPCPGVWRRSWTRTGWSCPRQGGLPGPASRMAVHDDRDLGQRHQVPRVLLRPRMVRLRGPGLHGRGRLHLVPGPG